MDRGPLYAEDYQPQLSGHETFPLRYGWLKKAFDAVDNAPEGDGRAVFADDDAIASFRRRQEYGCLDSPLGRCRPNHREQTQRKRHSDHKVRNTVVRM